jgi:branched-subunit amino acid transport protein
VSGSPYTGLIVAVAVVTYLTRISGFVIGQRQLPEGLGRFLQFVPVAVFAALVTTNFNAGQADMLPRLIGVIAAAVAVLRFRQLWIGLVAGMACFWLACALLGVSPA